MPGRAFHFASGKDDRVMPSLAFTPAFENAFVTILSMNEIYSSLVRILQFVSILRDTAVSNSNRDRRILENCHLFFFRAFFVELEHVGQPVALLMHQLSALAGEFASIIRNCTSIRRNSQDLVAEMK